MSAIARARAVARWLPVLLSLGFITASAGVDADTTPESTKLDRASQQLVIALAPTSAALAAPAASEPNTVPPQAVAAAPPVSTPLMAPLSAPAPARFFTISEVLAKRNVRTQSYTSIQLAAVDSSQTATDAGGYPPSNRNRGDEPFNLFSFTAPDGLLWTKWRKVVDDIRAIDPILTRCIADQTKCTQGGSAFSAIVKDARERKGRERLGLVNRRVNAAIRYENDMAQWSTPDVWSSPIEASGAGSFDTGFGDCEDFAIAKYVALRAAGVPAGRLRILLVHDKMARLDHAVLAAFDDGHWFILDNRWTTLVEDSETKQFVPLFALDEQGVKLLVTPYAAKQAPASEIVKTDSRIFVPG